MNTDKRSSWSKPVPAPTTRVEDFGNGIFINWKI